MHADAAPSLILTVDPKVYGDAGFIARDLVSLRHTARRPRPLAVLPFRGDRYSAG